MSEYQRFVWKDSGTTGGLFDSLAVRIQAPGFRKRAHELCVAVCKPLKNFPHSVGGAHLQGRGSVQLHTIPQAFTSHGGDGASPNFSR
ncbi:hypothetical protein OIU79_023538 [Salix purpurea]|uniref:Uncharacterized protein n=1 Tax=Salix purpurea TaxID=77065 RepID=A0A9Q0W8W2_SALPP|nr:hypothetical protein OIU79_023538 [Salix purpurea]